MTARLTLYSEGAPVLLLPPPLTTLGGSSAGSPPTVNFDTTSAVMRSGNVSLVDPTGVLIPDVDGNSDLLPGGNEILIEVTDNQGIWTPMGLLGIVTTNVTDSTDSPGPLVTMSLSDRAFVLGQSTSTTATQIQKGTPLEVATYLLLNAACPWIPDPCYQLDTTGVQLPSQTVDAGTNPFTTAQAWWTAVGAVLYVDEAGNIRGDTAPVDGIPYAAYTYAGGQLTSIETGFDASQAYNGVTVQTANPGVAPVQATAWDTDPNSPTWYQGPFGLRPAPTVSAETALDEAQCLLAAIRLLPRYLGLASTVITNQLPDPHLLPYTCAVLESAKDGLAGSLWQAQSGTYTVDDSTDLSVDWVPAGQPANWGVT